MYFQKKNPYTILPIKLLTPREFFKYNLLCATLVEPLPIITSNDEIDVLSIFSTAEIDKLRNDNHTFFVFDYTGEGTSYKEYINFFTALEKSAIRYNIPFYKIFFMSSNLLDEENYKNKNINVISFNKWDYFDPVISISFDKDFTNKTHFLNLNRVIRYFRVLTILKIVNSSIKDNLKISYDYLDLNLLKTISNTHYTKTGEVLNNTQLKNLNLSSPSILDRNDFHINWASDMPEDLFKTSIISLVSETLDSSINNTSIFYSEKTFKPMMFNHPICIFGQPNANRNLFKLGYKTYEKYFDLTFDSIEDYNQRLNTQITSLEVLNEKLLSMTPDQKFDWYMQGIDIIEHNKQVLKEQSFNKKKARIFLELLKQYAG